ncbi:MAG: NAD(P)H-hydrate dehydratase, partial [Gammaproteobacteria bacterium AqS3]|nr:NAD(P)H-hydrate dehydratase [Gammaproteobacteria bacterium AqS3]
RVMIVGGEVGMGGAVLLAGRAALRGGAGLVRIATRADNLPGILAAQPELMTAPVESGQDLDPVMDWPGVIVIGPGLGRSGWAQQLLQRVCARPAAGDKSLRVVLDADALNLLAERPDWWARLSSCAELVITPHPGEAARLLGVSGDVIQSDRPSAVRELAGRFGCTAVLKGAGSLVASASGGAMWLCPHGNPGLASGGSGDVLAGLIGALLGQGLPGLGAAAVGVHVHALAADDCARGPGERGLAAGDLPDAVRLHLNAL